MILKKYYVLFFYVGSVISMNNPKPATLNQAFVLMFDYSQVLCRRDADRPRQIQLPGGIVNSDISPIEALRNHLQNQTGINITTDLLKFVAQSTRIDANKQKLLELYYLVDSCGQEASSEDSHLFLRSITELAESQAYFPRDHTQEPLQVSMVLQRIAKHIKNGCKKYDEQEFLENKNEPHCKTQLELFPIELFSFLE